MSPTMQEITEAVYSKYSRFTPPPGSFHLIISPERDFYAIGEEIQHLTNFKPVRGHCSGIGRFEIRYITKVYYAAKYLMMMDMANWEDIQEDIELPPDAPENMYFTPEMVLVFIPEELQGAK